MALGFWFEIVNGKAVLRTSVVARADDADDDPEARSMEAAILPALFDALNSSALIDRPDDFFTALPMARLAENGPWLVLAKMHYLLPRSTFYLRNCFFEAADAISEQASTILTGPPGVGKTICLMYLLWQLVARPARRVMFVHLTDVVYFGPRAIHRLNALPPSRDGLWANDLWLLFDAEGKTAADLDDIPFEKCRLVLAAGSKNADVVQLVETKTTPLVFNMHEWTEDEHHKLAC
ncbi:hypothetical protein ACHHYP_11111 [Achlya hypogyna]|uniref:Crinkler (CRN) family protein n=1 Tax=Achlya hypogyna TaxID=1202772 RepID=A0A1V9YJU6_ACHHY|nr:hypothetical protein ACHHYP_11111 [Achlya hypogyna]